MIIKVLLPIIFRAINILIDRKEVEAEVGVWIGTIIDIEETRLEEIDRTRNLFINLTIIMNE